MGGVVCLRFPWLTGVLGLTGREGSERDGDSHLGKELGWGFETHGRGVQVVTECPVCGFLWQVGPPV